MHKEILGEVISPFLSETVPSGCYVTNNTANCLVTSLSSVMDYKCAYSLGNRSFEQWDTVRYAAAGEQWTGLEFSSV